MKHIEYKTIKVKKPDGSEGMLDYRAYLMVAIQNPLDGKAMALDEMRHCIRLMDAIEQGDDKGAHFEDADYEFLCKKVHNMRFLWADKAFETFVDDVTGA